MTCVKEEEKEEENQVDLPELKVDIENEDVVDKSPFNMLNVVQTSLLSLSDEKNDSLESFDEWSDENPLKQTNPLNKPVKSEIKTESLVQI